ncbi:prolyl oligopeptidase family serine peptidase [Ideonella sp. DXS22W]|uniref:Prolyl oligopeptidase family serine peptidase n=1 Tax=Pseudaquabacterium inlustre TaxID=2984192 RepID=A0ABU9CLM2_9BURK
MPHDVCRAGRALRAAWPVIALAAALSWPQAVPAQTRTQTDAQGATAAAAATPATRRLEGTLPSGARWLAEVPEGWRGSLLLFSHGYARGPANPARHVPRDEAAAALLAQGHALLGSSYARTGWAIEEAVPDQLAALDAFTQAVGRPKQVIAWGSSMGGLVTVALLEQHGARFAGGVALCASAAGTPGMMATSFDAAYAFKTLVAPGSDLPLRLNGAAAPVPAQRLAWQAAIDAAQATPLGRARSALAAALGQAPAWAVPGSPRPADDDVAARLAQLPRGLLEAVSLPRDDQERRAGGNFSGNAGVDYAALLAHSGQAAWVRERYAEAGASLDDDLATLARAPRVAADPPAAAYMARHYQPSGRPGAPLLLMQTVADAMTPAELSADYAHRAHAADAAAAGQGQAASLVASAWLERSGHCTFSTTEYQVALRALQLRIDSGRWAVAPEVLNAATRALGQPNADFTAQRAGPLPRTCAATPTACAAPDPRP